MFMSGHEQKERKSKQLIHTAPYTAKRMLPQQTKLSLAAKPGVAELDLKACRG